MASPIRTAIVLLSLAGAASAQTPAGGEFRINTYTTGRQQFARPAMEPDGDFVVVWRSYGQDGSDDGTFGQRFAASGAPRGSEFRINTYTTGSQGLPAVAVGSTGDFVVVWQSVQGGSFENIFGRRYDVSGSAIGGEFLVNTFTTGVQSRPSVGRASDGRFVVSWSSENVDGSAYGIAARRFDASGNPIGKEGAGYTPPACGTPMFNDVPASNPFCRYIEELARRGVVSGCGGGNYCPGSPVTREQMAVFVLRTLDPALNPPACVPPNIYNDVPETSPFCRWIEELTNRSVVGGCGAGNYCPTAPVTREQMGVFMSATFGLTLYGP